MKFDYMKSLNLMRKGLLVGGLLVCVTYMLKITWLMGIGWLILLASMGQALLFYKCPYCGERLSIRHMKADYCPNCHHKLAEAEQEK